jgi:hypothetical protein
VRVGGRGEPLVDVGLGEFAEGVAPFESEEAEEADGGIGLDPCHVGGLRRKTTGCRPDPQHPRLSPGQVALDLACGGRVVDGGEPLVGPGLEGGQILVAAREQLDLDQQLPQALPSLAAGQGVDPGVG